MDPESFRPWFRVGKIRIRDKHPGSATLHKRGHKNVGKLNGVGKYRTCEGWGSGEHVVGENTEAPPVHLLPMPAVPKNNKKHIKEMVCTSVCQV